VIVDVHTHTPRHRTPLSGGATVNAAWRSDQTRPTSLTWDDQMAALEAVDRRWIVRFGGGKQGGCHATLNRRTISSSTSTPSPGPVGTGIMPSTISIVVVHRVLSKDAEETLNSR
jgi:hypothetical protein